MVRVLRPTFMILGLAFLAAAFAWVGVPGLRNYPLPALQGVWPVAQVRQAKGPVRFFDGVRWRFGREGDASRGALAFSAGKGGTAIVEVPGHGFLKLEENSLVTLDPKGDGTAGAGLQVRVIRGNADIRATTPGAMLLERRPGSRAPIVRAPEPEAPKVSSPERSVAKAPVAIAPLKKARAPARTARAPEVRPGTARRGAPRAPARVPALTQPRVSPRVPPMVPPPMVPKILPIQVE